MQIQELALREAASQLGVRELPKNRGPKVEEYLASVGLRAGEPWCAAFVYWCIERACRELAKNNLFPRTGLCERIRHWAIEKQRLVREPKPGDVFLVLEGGRAHHTGFVESVTGRVVTTLEGNTNLANSREGVGVFRRRRMVSSLLYVRWTEAAKT